MNPNNMLVFIMIFPLIGSFVGFLLGKKNEKVRDVFNIIMTGVTFLGVMLLYRYVKTNTIEVSIPYIMGTGLHLKLNMFRYIFIWLTSFVWVLTTVYSTQYLISYKNRNRYYLFFMLTLWSTIGVFVSENFLNLFTFFEIMSLTSYALIIHDEDDYSHEAGDTYIVMAITGGLILLMGLFLLFDYTKTLDIMELQTAFKSLGNVKYFIVSLIIIGFGVKAGMVPLHVWLPKAHPAAPAPASAVLSGILLKTGIFGILVTVEIIMEGDPIVSTVILILGFINMLVGGFLAMFQRNIKRILAYSSMSQIGYILVGIGLIGILKDHREMAVYATLYHIINHAIFKVLLFMGAGVIYMALHELSINKIGGFGRNKKILKVIFLIGLCAIIGMPGFNGFASKTMLHHALAEAENVYGGTIAVITEIIFTISSSFTVAYLLKIFMAVFVDKSNNDIEKEKTKITGRAMVPMGILAAIIIYIGIQPGKILNVLEGAVSSFGVSGGIEPHFYTIGNIKSSAITIFLGILIYVYFVRKYLRKGSGDSWQYENITLNWFSIEKGVYIPLGRWLFNVSSFVLKGIDQSVIKGVSMLGNSLIALGNKKFRLKKSIESRINGLPLPDRINNLKDIQEDTSLEDRIGVVRSVNEQIGELSRRLNSVTYSIFIFAAVLVACLFIMIS